MNEKQIVNKLDNSRENIEQIIESISHKVNTEKIKESIKNKPFYWILGTFAIGFATTSVIIKSGSSNKKKSKKIKKNQKKSKNNKTVGSLIYKGAKIILPIIVKQIIDNNKNTNK